MSLSTHYLEYGRHVARPRRRRRRCRHRPAYMATSNTDNHKKINLWVFFSFPYDEYGAPVRAARIVTASAQQHGPMTHWGP